MQEKKLLFILNPRAGRNKPHGPLFDALAILSGAGYLIRIHETAAPEDAAETVAREGKSYDLIVAAGGDGTLNEVISGLMRLDAPPPLGYLPQGTTNDFASSLQIPRDPAAAAERIAQQNVRALDIGQWNQRSFIYVASFGAFTRASYAAPQAVKNAVGHLAYIFEGIRDLANIRPYAVTVEAEGEVRSGEFIFGMVGNSTSMGGVLRLDPKQIDLHDGKFEVMLVRKPQHIGQLIAAAVALQSQNYDNELLCFFKAAHLRISTHGDMDWTLDGEFQPGAEHIEIRNLHDAVRLILPRG